MLDMKELSKRMDEFMIKYGRGYAELSAEDELKIKNTVRVSLYFYNTKEEIDYFISSLKRVLMILK